MQQSFLLFLVLGLALLLTAVLFGLFGAAGAATGAAAGLAVAGGLSVVAAALVVRRSQADEATIRTLERRVFDLESELEARAGDGPPDEEP